MKSILLITFAFFYSTTIVGQNIIGNYKYEYLRKTDQRNVVLEINILNDTTFHMNSYEGNKPDEKSYEKTKVLGKIKKVKNNRYQFSEYNTVTKQYIDHQIPVKITSRKIVFYAYKQIRPGKVSKKPEKSFIFKRASI